MNKYFNVAGPCIPDKHYMLPAQERCRGILELIDQEQYFVIHRIIREMAGGRKILDLGVEYQEQRYPIELKIRMACIPSISIISETL